MTVVFPAPTNPVNTVTGIILFITFNDKGFVNKCYEMGR